MVEIVTAWAWNKSQYFIGRHKEVAESFWIFHESFKRLSANEISYGLKAELLWRLMGVKIELLREH